MSQTFGLGLGGIFFFLGEPWGGGGGGSSCVALVGVRQASQMRVGFSSPPVIVPPSAMNGGVATSARLLMKRVRRASV